MNERARPGAGGGSGRGIAGAGLCLLAATVLVGFWRGAPGESARAAAAQEAAAGQVLVEALGCGACHAGVTGGEAIRGVAPPFGDGAAPVAPAYVFHYMADPQTVRPDIAPARMPRYELDERQRVALALFVTNDREMRGVDDALREAMARHADADRAEGAALFGALNCAGCHVHREAEPRVTAPDLSLTGLRVRPEWLTGYLTTPVTIRPAGPVPGEGGQMPDFRLGAAEAASIADYLLGLDGGVGDPPAEATTDSPATTDPPAGPPAGAVADPPAEATTDSPATTDPPAGPPAGAVADPPAELTDWEPQSLSPFAMQKAEVLLRNRWSCLGCHQLGDDGGRIGPRLDGIAHRLRPGYVRALLQEPEHLAPGTIMPASLEQPDRLDLIASYLLRRNGEWTGSEPVSDLPALPALPAQAASMAPGAALYNARCAPCHGVGGEGDGFNAPFLPVAPTVHADSAAMSLRPDDTLYDGIHAGGWILGKSHRMPAFGASLDDGEKRALVSYIRTLCRCEGPAWSHDGRRGR